MKGAKRGTVIPGALAVILIFIIAMSSMAFLIAEFSQYSRSVRLAGSSASERNRELLNVALGEVQDGVVLSLNVTNAGPTPSLVVGWIKVNPAGNNPSFTKYSVPITVPLLGTVSVEINPTPKNWDIGVLTSYGNVFWASLPPSHPFDFSVSVSPDSGSVMQGGSTTATVTVALLSGLPQTVSLSAFGLPSGASASFNPSSDSPTFTSIMTIKASASTPTGTYAIMIAGTSEDLIRGATYTLTVTEPWLAGWQYRKSHVINPASGAGTNYQIRITAHYGSGTDGGEHVYLNSHSRMDFGDVRITGSDGVTLLDHWMEKKVDGDYAVFWVEVADDLSANSATIYIYYGKADATTTSNGEATFLFFDDFLGTTLDTGKWVSYIGSGCSISVADSVATLSRPASAVQVAMWSINNFANIRMRTKVYPSTLATYNRCYRWALMSDKTTRGDYLHIDIKGHGWVVDDYNNRYYERYKTARSSVGVSIVQNWRVYETRWKSNTKIVEGYDDTIENTFTSNIPDVGLYVNFACGSASGIPQNAYNLKVDWVFIAKYVDPEPAHGSWGMEEAA